MGATVRTPGLFCGFCGRTHPDSVGCIPGLKGSSPGMRCIALRRHERELTTANVSIIVSHFSIPITHIGRLAATCVLRNTLSIRANLPPPTGWRTIDR